MTANLSHEVLASLAENSKTFSETFSVDIERKGNVVTVEVVDSFTNLDVATALQIAEENFDEKHDFRVMSMTTKRIEFLIENYTDLYF